MHALWQRVIAVPSWLLIAAVRCYQLGVSPFIGPRCRFQPTCSQYFIEAVRKYGAIRGSWKGLFRIGRCHPWGGSGYDLGAILGGRGAGSRIFGRRPGGPVGPRRLPPGGGGGRGRGEFRALVSRVLQGLITRAAVSIRVFAGTCPS